MGITVLKNLLCAIFVTLFMATAASANTMVLLETDAGKIKVALEDKKAPKSVKNFLNYVKKGHYDGLIFHRVIKGFMIQGGGFNEHMSPKPAGKPIINEAFNGLKNKRGTLAMARKNDPNSATAQFFINTVNNTSLNYSPLNPGYAVFGKVVEGMDVVDKISNVPTGKFGPYGDVPSMPIHIIKVSVVSE